MRGRPRTALGRDLLGVALLAALGSTLGCTYTAAIITDDGRGFAPTAPATVALYPGRDPGFPYEIIGPVAVLTMGEAPEAMRELAVQAAALGADAVVGVRLSKLSKNTGADGVAVKRLAPPPSPMAPPAPPLSPPAAPVPPAPPAPPAGAGA
jgi:hypothetical protein